MKAIIAIVGVIVIAVVIFAVAAGGSSCDGMEMPDGECIWVPDGTKIDGEVVGE